MRRYVIRRAAVAVALVSIPTTASTGAAASPDGAETAATAAVSAEISIIVEVLDGFPWIPLTDRSTTATCRRRSARGHRTCRDRRRASV